MKRFSSLSDTGVSTPGSGGDATMKVADVAVANMNKNSNKNDAPNQD